jgi:hypothetical protein
VATENEDIQRSYISPKFSGPLPTDHAPPGYRPSTDHGYNGVPPGKHSTPFPENMSIGVQEGNETVGSNLPSRQDWEGYGSSHPHMRGGASTLSTPPIPPLPFTNARHNGQSEMSRPPYWCSGSNLENPDSGGAVAQPRWQMDTTVIQQKFSEELQVRPSYMECLVLSLILLYRSSKTWGSLTGEKTFKCYGRLAGICRKWSTRFCRARSRRLEVKRSPGCGVYFMYFYETVFASYFPSLDITRCCALITAGYSPEFLQRNPGYNML